MLGQNTHKLERQNQSTSPDQTQKDCTCARNAPCPLGGMCNRKDIVYEAKIQNISTKTKYTYFGQTSTTFKERLSTHKYSFRHISAKNQTEMSKLIWKFKGKNLNFEIQWNLVRFAPSYKPGNKFCKLCISEINQILFYSKSESESILINKREEFMNKCKHRDRWKLHIIWIF